MQAEKAQVDLQQGVDVKALVAQMTLAEKIGQMTQVEKGSLSTEDVTTYFIGSVLSGGGGNPEVNTASGWMEMVQAFQEAALETRLKIPLIYGVDAVHGHNNVKDAVIFPHNIGLGATRDADLLRRIADITRKELLATGVHWDFAPAVSVPHDIRWGRTYEGFSEDTDLVTELALAYMEGLQNADPSVLASIKHYVADGGTEWGTSKTYEWISGNWQAPGDYYKIDQGDSRLDEATLRAVHLPPYKAAIDAGAMNVMASFSSWQGLKMHAHRYLLTDVLKHELGLKGFIVSDWMAVSQIDPDYNVSVAMSINAGVDMVMVPYDFKLFIQTLTHAVETGAVSMERIDDAVERILLTKAWLGLFEKPFGVAEYLPEFGSDPHRQVAREAARKSFVLLKNADQVLPLSKSSQILLAGKGAEDIGMQCGGWSITWQGEHGQTTLGKTAFAGIREAVGDDAELAYDVEGDFGGDTIADVGIVFVGESPYAEGLGDNSNLYLSEADKALVKKMRPRCHKLVVILLSGRPLIITEELELADAFIAAWLPGSEAGNALADVLFGDFPFTGKLSVSWPRDMSQVPFAALKASPEPPLFPFGFGL